MIHRRSFLRIALAGLGGPLAVLPQPLGSAGQPPAKTARVGFLSPFSASVAAPWHRAFREGLRELGWVEGQNVTIEYRHANGKDDRLPGLAADLVRLKVDVIVTSIGTDALIAKRATPSIPIVMASAGTPSRVDWLRASRTPAATSRG